MMNQTAQRIWKAGSSMLRPSCLIDRFLDWVEQQGAVLAPARPDSLYVQEIRIEIRRDHIRA